MYQTARFRSLIFFVILLTKVAGKEDEEQPIVFYQNFKDIEPLSYYLEIMPDPKEMTFLGVENIRFKTKRSSKYITLASNLNVSKAFVNNTPVTFSSNSSDHSLRVHHDFEEASYDVGLMYNGQLQQPSFFGLVYDPSQNILETALQPGYAHYMFPCFEDPGLVAKFDLVLRKDKAPLWDQNYIEISNMPRIVYRVLETQAFLTTGKIPPHSLQLFVSKFKNISIITRQNGKIYLVGDGRSDRKADSVFAEGFIDNVLNYYNDVLKKDLLPYQNLDYLHIIGSPQFSGMSVGPGCIIVDETYLFTQNDSFAFSKYGVAHKTSLALAKMWFGNLLTASWENTWILEGLAKIMHLTAINTFFPEWKSEALYLAGEMDEALSADCCGHEYTFSDINQISKYRSGESRAYAAKSLAIIRMIYYKMTPEKFFKACEKFVKMYASKRIEKEQFYNFFNAFEIDQWVSQPGYPIIFVSLPSTNYSELSIKPYYYFEQNVNEVVDPKKNKVTWSLPISYLSLDTKAWVVRFTRDTQPLLFREKSVVVVNAQGILYCRVNYTEELWSRIVNVLDTPNLGNIDELSRVTLVRDLTHFTKEGEIDKGQYLMWMRFMRYENSYAVWKIAFKYFNILFDSFSHCVSRTRQMMEKYLRRMVQNMTLQLTPLPETPYTEFRKTDLLIKYVCTLTYSCTDQANDIVLRYFAADIKTRVEPRWQNAVYIFCATGRDLKYHAAKAAYDKIIKSDDDEKGKFYAWAVIACRNGVDYYKKIFETVRLENHRPAFLLMPRMSCSGYPYMLKYLKENQDKLASVPREYLAEMINERRAESEGNLLQELAETTEFRKKISAKDFRKLTPDAYWFGKLTAGSIKSGLARLFLDKTVWTKN